VCVCVEWTRREVDAIFTLTSLASIDRSLNHASHDTTRLSIHPTMDT